MPVEELSYRLSRVWSPIGHLNSVANSADMREAFNECVPLLTAYSSELGQKRRPAGRLCLCDGARGRCARAGAAQGGRKCIARLSARGRGFAAGRQEPLPRGGAAAGAAVHQILGECAGCGARLHAPGSRTVRSWPVCPPNAVDRAAADAREANQTGWLFKLDQPNLHDHHVQRRERAAAARYLRGVDHPGIRARPQRRTIRQQFRHRRNSAPAA